MLDYAINFLKHQDIFKKNITAVNDVDGNKVLSTKEGEWLVTTNTTKYPQGFSKVFFCLSVDAKNIIDCALANIDDTKIRILLFDQEGIKRGHITPFTLKNHESPKKALQSIVDHARE